MSYPIAQIVNLIPAESQRLWSTTAAEAERRLLSRRRRGRAGARRLVRAGGARRPAGRAGAQPGPAAALLPRQGGRAGPCSCVAERIDAIARELARRGWSDQFHPSYTRMVPAHHVTTLQLVGCPDPNPRAHALLRPAARQTLPADLDAIGRVLHRGALHELRRWLAAQDPAAPIGVPFSGGIDSGAVLLALYKLLLDQGQSPARLKAFTLAVDGGGDDARAGARLPGAHATSSCSARSSRRPPARSIRCVRWP